MMRTTLVSLWVAMLVGLPGCKPRQKRFVDQPELVSQALASRQEHVRRLQSMKISELVAALESDSRAGAPPFDSLAYAEVCARGAESKSALLASIHKDAASAFLPLLAMRKVDASAYAQLEPKLRIGILVHDLQNARYYNAWGLPHLGWEEAALALIAEPPGEELKRLLSDKRSAPVFGSEASMESFKYQYRVCDYAWALLNDARQKHQAIPVSQTERDALISKER